MRFLGLMLLVLLTTARVHAQGSRTYFNQDIFIAQGQQAHNATCIFCSVQVEGDLTGHVFVLFGNLNVTGRVGGRATVIGGNAVIDSQARVGGNALVVGGNAVYETDDSISGNAWVIGGHLSPIGGVRVHSTHRVSFSPYVFTGAAIAVFLLLSVLFIPRRRSETV
jgi:NDP-sugar pyrophosphorylase family protein